MLLPGATALLISCSSLEYENCASDRMVGEWGVVNKTHAFGEYDSLYYIVNPIGNINDTVYYNGNYTDSYYHSDPVRIMLRYNVNDSIYFSFDRLYVTQTNPKHMVMMAQVKDDTLKRECVLYLEKRDDDDKLYSCGPDSLFKQMLRAGKPLSIQATNGASTSEPEGSQNYEFTFYPTGFTRALAFADSLNPKPVVKRDSVKSAADSLKGHDMDKKKDSHPHHHHLHL